MGGCVRLRMGLGPKLRDPLFTRWVGSERSWVVSRRSPSSREQVVSQRAVLLQTKEGKQDLEARSLSRVSKALFSIVAGPIVTSRETRLTMHTVLLAVIMLALGMAQVYAFFPVRRANRVV